MLSIENFHVRDSGRQSPMRPQPEVTIARCSVGPGDEGVMVLVNGQRIEVDLFQLRTLRRALNGFNKAGGEDDCDNWGNEA